MLEFQCSATSHPSTYTCPPHASTSCLHLMPPHCALPTDIVLNARWGGPAIRARSPIPESTQAHAGTIRNTRWGPVWWLWILQMLVKQQAVSMFWDTYQSRRYRKEGERTRARGPERTLRDFPIYRLTRHRGEIDRGSSWPERDASGRHGPLQQHIAHRQRGHCAEDWIATVRPCEVSHPKKYWLDRPEGFSMHEVQT